jgi:hypothetical protein
MAGGDVMAEYLAELDKWYPPCGPCMFCGHKDKRHRLWDVWMGEADSGESAEEIATDFEEPLEYVRAVLRIRPYEA